LILLDFFLSPLFLSICRANPLADVLTSLVPW
jgi:hypothetical protein